MGYRLGRPKPILSQNWPNLGRFWGLKKALHLFCEKTWHYPIFGRLVANFWAVFHFWPKNHQNWRFCDFGGNCTGWTRTFSENSANLRLPPSSDRFEQKLKIFKKFRFSAQIEHCSGVRRFSILKIEKSWKIFSVKNFGRKITKMAIFDEPWRPVGSPGLKFGPKLDPYGPSFGQPSRTLKGT